MKRGTIIAMTGGALVGGAITWMWPIEHKTPDAAPRSLTGRTAPLKLPLGNALPINDASTTPSAFNVPQKSVSFLRSSPADCSLSKAEITALIGDTGHAETVHKALTTALNRAVASQTSQNPPVELQGSTRLTITAVPQSDLDEVAAALAEELGSVGISSEAVQTITNQFRADLNSGFGQDSEFSARLVDYLPCQPRLEPGFLIRTEQGGNQEAAVPLGRGMSRFPWITVPADPKGEREQTVPQIEVPADFVLPD